MKAIKENSSKVETKSPQAISPLPPVPKQLVAATHAQDTEVIASNSYTSVRYRIEEMASEIKAIGEKYPDLRDHTSAIRMEMGKLVHFTIDREFTDTVPVKASRGDPTLPTKSSLNGGAKHLSLEELANRASS